MPSTRQHRKNDNTPGHAHELTFSCYQRHNFLEAERTCCWLADSINSARQELNFDLWAYVFMPNHVHMIVWPRDSSYDIAEIRQAIKQPTSRRVLAWMKHNSPEWLPKVTRSRGGRVERLFWKSGGGYDRNITEGSTLLKMIDYIHLNPVCQGLVERPEEWRWSSASSFAGYENVPLTVDSVPVEWLH